MSDRKWSSTKHAADAGILMDLTPVGIYETNAKGECIYVNLAWQQISGLTEEQSMGHGWSVVMHPDDVEYVREQVAIARAGESDFQFEYRLLRPDKVVKWIRIHSRVIRGDEQEIVGRLGTIIDITEQKKLEAELRRAKMQEEEAARRARLDQVQLREIIGSAPIEMVMLDETLRCIAHSRSWAEQYAPGEFHLMGRNLNDILKEMPPQWRTALTYARRGQPTTQSEDQLTNGAGQIRHVKWAIHPWYKTNGEVGGIVLLTESIDDIVAAREVSLAAARVKDQFVANMSHEIRTPCNGVVGMTSLLLETALSDEQRGQVETIRYSAESLLTIVNDILDFSKSVAGKLELETSDFALATLVTETAQFYQVTMRKDAVAFKVAIDDRLARMVRGDAARVRQTLGHLIGNALKFTAKGEVRVSVSQMPGERIRFEVSDTGIGIAADWMQKIFEPFTQVDASSTRSFGGTGLGLSIAKTLTEKMGGQIGVESELGRGSKFWFVLPLKAVFEAPKLVSDISPAGPKSARILVAEDNLVNQRIILFMLKKMGHDVVAVENGRQAVEATQQDLYDLVIMDCQMPEMDGYEATRRIKGTDKSKHTPVIAFTAHAMLEDKQKCLDAGMDDYMTKPASFERLSGMVSKWLDKTREEKLVS